MLFGIGASSILKFSLLNGMLTAHNGYIEKLVEFGIVGLIILTIILVSILKGKTFNPFKNYYALPIFAYLASILTLGMSGAELPFFLLGLVGMGYTMTEKTNLKEAYYRM
jgi:O-antigen ligase